MKFWIAGSVPSSKNSKVFTGRYLINSKATRAYVKESEDYWLSYRDEFRLQSSGLEKPLRIKFTFVRGSRHKFDYCNAIQIVSDLMRKPVRKKNGKFGLGFDWIDDDNADEMIPVFGEYEYSKESPGVWIEILGGSDKKDKVL